MERDRGEIGHTVEYTHDHGDFGIAETVRRYGLSIVVDRAAFQREIDIDHRLPGEVPVVPRPASAG
ncbi:MAG: hypothetical protein JKP98_14540 [Rhodobacteraceae bacterium]|nr:hypothetical protein [Paracoccaceae bacterium]